MKPVDSPKGALGGYQEDQLYLLTLCLELQLDLLLVALRSPEGADPASADSGFQPRWVGDTLDLTGDPAGGESGRQHAWLADRYAALTDAIDEMLGNGEVRKNPAVMARLAQARSTCEERLATLPVAAAAPPEASDVTGVEAGHYLG